MLKRLHQGLGVGLAAYLVVAAGSGMLLLWSDEYVDWRYPMLPEDAGLIEPDATVIGRITASAGPDLVTLGLPRPSRPAYHAYFADGSEALYHPYSGTRAAAWTWTDSLPAFLFELHVYLLAGQTGHYVVGIAGIVLLASLLTGPMLWFRRRETFRFRYYLPRRAERKYLLRAHAAQGAVLALLALIVVFSGVALVFPAPVQSAFNAALGVEMPLRPRVAGFEQAGKGPVNWHAALEATATAFPDGTPRFVSPPGAGNDAVVVRLRQHGELHPNGRSYAVVHPVSGVVIETVDATTRGPGPALFDALYPLHAGKTGWPGHRLLLALMSLSLLYVAVSGTWLFLSRRRRGRVPAGPLRRPVTPSAERSG